MQIRELMSDRVETIHPDDTVGSAARRMVGRGIRHLPVVDKGKLVGLLAEIDLLAFRGYGGVEAKVSDAMNTQFVSVGPDADAAETAELMARRKTFCIPVVDDGTVVGVVTSSDLLLFRARNGNGKTSSEQTVESVMSADPTVVHPDDYLLDALGRMSQMGVRHLPVVDGAGKVLGILSDRDVRRAVGDLMVSEGEDGLRVRTRNLRVIEVASKGPLTVRPESSVSEAARLLVTRKIGALPVVDGAERLVGIVSYVDLLAVLASP